MTREKRSPYNTLLKTLNTNQIDLVAVPTKPHLLSKHADPFESKTTFTILAGDGNGEAEVVLPMIPHNAERTQIRSQNRFLSLCSEKKRKPAAWDPGPPRDRLLPRRKGQPWSTAGSGSNISKTLNLAPELTGGGGLLGPNLGSFSESSTGEDHHDYTLTSDDQPDVDCQSPGDQIGIEATSLPRSGCSRGPSREAMSTSICKPGRWTRFFGYAEAKLRFLGEKGFGVLQVSVQPFPVRGRGLPSLSHLTRGGGGATSGGGFLLSSFCLPLPSDSRRWSLNENPESSIQALSEPLILLISRIITLDQNISLVENTTCIGHERPTNISRAELWNRRSNKYG